MPTPTMPPRPASLPTTSLPRTSIRCRHRPAWSRPTRCPRHVPSSGLGDLGACLFGDDPSSDETVLVFTPDGLVRILPRASKSGMRARVDAKLGEQEAVCGDPDVICVGATFAVCATNGYDITRRMNFQGFCQSPDILGESIEDAVLGRGGEIVETEKLSKDGAEQTLVMTVALPLLFGVPPEMDTIKAAIEIGGGFLHKTYGEWHMY